MEPIKSDYDILTEMAESYAEAGNRLAVIKNEKSTAVLMLMTECKTNTEANWRWSATPSGQEETTLTFLLKGLEKRMAALRTKINASKPY